MRKATRTSNTSPQLTAELSEEAELDIAEALQWSRKTFGKSAAQRYAELISAALKDIEGDYRRLGTKARPELPGKELYSYHLRYSRDSVDGDRVFKPRHTIIYRREDHRLEIVRFLHDSRDVKSHL